MPSIPDPSEKIWMKVGSRASSGMARPRACAMCILMPGCHLGDCRMGRMVSVMSGSMLNVSMMW